MAVEQVGFKTSMFGFRKDDVLACIDRISAENLAVQQQAEARAKELTEALEAAQAEKDVQGRALCEKKEEIEVLETALATQTEVAAQAMEQVNSLTQALAVAETAVRDYKGRLFTSEGQATVLRRDNTRLTETLSQKQQEVERASAMAEAVCAESAAELEKVRTATAKELVAERARLQNENLAVQQEMKVSGADMAQEVLALKDALASLDVKIAASLSDIQRSTKALAQALEATEQNVQHLGIKLEAFPKAVPESAQAREQAKEQPVPHVPRPQVRPRQYSDALPHSPEKTPTISSLLLAKIAKMIGEV